MKKYLILLLFPIFAFAGIGKITALSGDVKIKRDAGTIQAKLGTQLQKNDFISTNAKGKVQIIFKDKTVFTIGKSSTLDIADYLYDESKPKKNSAKFNVLKGAFSSITGRIGKLNKSKFKLKTKSASIGIRGTIVKANQTEVICTEGAITVETLSGATVRVEAGEKTVISNGMPSVPAAATDADVKQMDKEAGVTANGTADEQNIQTQIKEEAGLSAAGDQESTQIESQKLEGVQESEAEFRDVTLTGRTIDSDGNQQYITIDAQNIQGELSLENSGLTMTDDQGNSIDSTSDESISWGHWNNDPSKKWVAGQETDIKIIDDLRTGTNTVNATYSGKVMGSVNGSDEIKMDQTNSVNINFELGQNKNNMDGDMNFETNSGQNWSAEFEGSVSGNSFSSSAMTGGNVDSGTVDGKFYGNDAQSVGGTFDLDKGADKATGVFKADKQ